MEQISKNLTSVACTINRRQRILRLITIVNVIYLIIINLTTRQAEASSFRMNPHQHHRALIDSTPTAASTLQPSHSKLQVNDTAQLADMNGAVIHEASDQLKVANNLETNALIYLQRYGYMQAHSNAGANNLISEDSFSNAISSFQKFAGIPETGIVDEETWLYMQMPRCGNLDKTSLDSSKLPQQLAAKVRLNLARAVKKRRKRYALQGSKWRRQELTYRISQYPTRFNGKRHEVDSQIERAFGIWSQVAPIDFVVKKEGRVHIDIRFASGDHGDGDAFDGPGNTLAHAYFPQYGGDAHFDDQEYWTIDSYAGTNIFQVAAHELGHSLGLGHSNVREALMAPFYQKYKPNFKLHVDDILAIQALYGEKPYSITSDSVPPITPTTTPTTTTTTSTTTTTTSAPTTTTAPASVNFTNRYTPITTRLPYFVGSRRSSSKPSRPPVLDGRETNDDENGLPELPNLGGNGIGFNGAEDRTPNSRADGANSFPAEGSGVSYPADLCSEPSIDAITRTEDGNSYVFKGDFYWLLTNEGLAKGYPRRIATDWEGLPGGVDAALTWADGKTFFFKGNKYWRYRNKRRDIGYPKLISAGFAGIPDDIDAAFVWSGNGRTYIFKGADYWRFDSKADPPVSSEYPRSIKVWQGVPAHVNAAFRWENNVTYFFKGSQYYRFNDKEFKVEARGRPPFPRPSADWWFGCVSSNLAQRALPGGGASASESQEVSDWSYYAGLKDNTRIMGTHISDHKPPLPPADMNESSGRRRIDGDNEPLDYDSPRLGFRHPTATRTTTSVSSSAISLVQQCNHLIINVLLLSNILLAITTTLTRPIHKAQ